VLSRLLSGLHVFHLYSKGGSSKRLNSEFIRDLLGDTDNYKIGFTKTLVCLISIPNISLQLARYELPLEAQSVMPLVCFQYATVAEHNHQLFTSEQLPVGCSSNHRQAAWTPNSCLICKCFHHDIICLKAYLQSNFIEDHINIATSSSSSSNNLLTPSLIYSWSVLAFLG